MADYSEQERKLWCKAWRLLRKHGPDARRLVDAEIARCLAARDRAKADEWRAVAQAMRELAD